MGAHRAAWASAFTAELAARDSIAGCRLDFAANLLDLVKAFEHIPHHILAYAACRHGYPVALLRLAIAAYRIARSIGIGGLYSRLIRASRGITAGSGSATSELRLLLIGLILTISTYWPQVDVKLYVDDLSLSMTGHALSVAATVSHATSFAISIYLT